MQGFELLRKVAEGSAAEAFLARAPGAKHSVLVEVSRAEVLEDVELYGRFLDRAMGRKDFHHPHLVELMSAGCAPDGRVYVATEPIDGPTIADHLTDQGPYEPQEAVRLLVSIAAALEYLHGRNVVHANLCPKNVYLTGPAEKPVPKLLEMGLLLFRTNRSFKSPPATRLVAEPYLSPERAAGHRADVRSDVYGLGVLLFELITGRPPYAARSLHQTAPIPVLPPEAQPLAEIVSRCLAKEPSHRYGSAREVQLALEAVRFERDALSTLDIQVALEERPAPPPIIVGKTVSQRGPVTPAKGTANKVIVGSYEVIRPLGEGGMGRVFLARHLKLDRLVALKTLKAVYAHDPLHLQRFVQEARAVNRVKHPHLVEIFDFLEEGPGRVCCVMEPLFGETLKDRAKKAPLPIHTAVRIMRQACSALSAVHQAGVIHRDLKPDNLFLVDREAEHDFVKVLDFGIAQVRDDAESFLTTRTGEVVGTPAYMSPEQTMPGPLDGRSDIYSLATVLYVLLQGRFPHDATQPEQLLAQKVTHKPRPVSSFAASGEPIPKALRAVIDKCLQKNPAARYQTMDELEVALAPFETAIPQLPPPLPPSRAMRRAWTFAAAGASALALTAGAWVWTLAETEPPSTLPPFTARQALAPAAVAAPPEVVMAAEPEVSVATIAEAPPMPEPVKPAKPTKRTSAKKKRPARK